MIPGKRSIMNREQVTAKLDAAFTALRKQGFIARKGFMCCSTCAWAEFNCLEKKMPKEKKDWVKGYVFYNRQDRAGMFTKPGRFSQFQGLYLAYDGVNGRTQTQAGELVCTALRDAGLEVEWDGKPTTRIYVKP